MSVLVYVKDNQAAPLIIGSWSTVEEACKHANTILTSGAFLEVIIVAEDDGKSSPTTLPDHA